MQVFQVNTKQDTNYMYIGLALSHKVQITGQLTYDIRENKDEYRLVVVHNELWLFHLLSHTAHITTIH